MASLALLLALTFALITLGYIMVCLASPFGPCPRCHNATPTRQRTCHRCHGTGIHPRLGWRAWTHLTRLHRDGTR